MQNLRKLHSFLWNRDNKNVTIHEGAAIAGGNLKWQRMRKQQTKPKTVNLIHLILMDIPETAAKLQIE